MTPTQRKKYIIELFRSKDYSKFTEAWAKHRDLVKIELRNKNDEKESKTSDTPIEKNDPLAVFTAPLLPS